MNDDLRMAGRAAWLLARHVAFLLLMAAVAWLVVWLVMGLLVFGLWGAL